MFLTHQYCCILRDMFIYAYRSSCVYFSYMFMKRIILRFIYAYRSSCVYFSYIFMKRITLGIFDLVECERFLLKFLLLKCFFLSSWTEYFFVDHRFAHRIVYLDNYTEYLCWMTVSSRYIILQYIVLIYMYISVIVITLPAISLSQLSF